MRVIRTAASAAGAAGLTRAIDLDFQGEMDAALANTGQVAGRIDAVRSVADMWSGVSAALDLGRSRLG